MSSRNVLLLLAVVVVLFAPVAVTVVVVVVVVELRGGWMRRRLRGTLGTRGTKVSVLFGGCPGNCVGAGAGGERDGSIWLKVRERKLGAMGTKLRDAAVEVASRSYSIGRPSTRHISHPEENSSSSSGSSGSSRRRNGITCAIGCVGGDIVTARQTDNTRTQLVYACVYVNVFGGRGVRTSARGKGEGKKGRKKGRSRGTKSEEFRLFVQFLSRLEEYGGRR